MPKVETHLSRGEVMTLLYDKLHLIQGECEAYCGEDADLNARKLADVKKRLKRIAVEARRAASLIETYEHIAKAGHCLHCGQTYEEHSPTETPLPDGAPRVRVKGAEPEQPRCYALQRLFESVELETYKPLALDVSDA